MADFKFGIGDFVMVCDGYSNDFKLDNYAGAGYASGTPILTISSFHEGIFNGNECNAYFFEFMRDGIYEFALIGVHEIIDDKLKELLYLNDE